MQCFSGVTLGVFPEGDETGEGRDQSSNTANVDTQQQFPVIVRELGK